MRRFLVLCACVTVFSVWAFAESFTGRLIDASCYDQQKNAATCDPSGSSTSFALLVSGKAYKLDDAGNAKAVEALKNRADRSSDPAKAPSQDPTKPAVPDPKMAANQVMAKITGTTEGDSILKVEALEVQ